MRTATAIALVIPIMALLVLSVYCAGVGVEQPAPKTGLRCRAHDQLAYCVYERSLCLVSNGGNGAELLVITRQPLEQPDNVLQASPWHLPSLGRVFEGSNHSLPYRSFFARVQHASEPPAGAVWLSGWTLVASFDDQGSNIYHFVNKMQVAWVARLYEMPMANKGYDHAYVFRGPYTSWQAGFAELALGAATKTVFMSALLGASSAPVCFERAIVPGAALYLSDGLASSVLFREMAATQKAIRVPPAQRNVITLFVRPLRDGKRAILNVDEVEALCKEEGAPHGLVVERVHWTAETPFEVQAMQMARSKVYITAHGSVLNHCIFMEPGEGAVIELNPYQFLYPLDQQIVLNRGLYYLRHEASPEDTTPLPPTYEGWSSKSCFANADCYVARRDANLRMDLEAMRLLLRQAISLVVAAGSV